MISFLIEDTKNCMTQLLKEATFDDFLCIAFELTSIFKISMDGQLRVEALNSDEIEIIDQERDYIQWKEFRGNAFQLIRGDKAPTIIKITFALSKKSVEAILKRINFTESSAIAGFNFTLLYEQKRIKITTGTNYIGFTMDKSAERYFDDSMLKFFKKHEIPVLLSLE